MLDVLWEFSDPELYKSRQVLFLSTPRFIHEKESLRTTLSSPPLLHRLPRARLISPFILVPDWRPAPPVSRLARAGKGGGPRLSSQPEGPPHLSSDWPEQGKWAAPAAAIYLNGFGRAREGKFRSGWSPARGGGGEKWSVLDGVKVLGGCTAATCFIQGYPWATGKNDTNIIHVFFF